MQQHLIKFVADPTSSSSEELGSAFAPSLDDAKDTAKAGLPKYREQCPTAGYRIEDLTGRTVWIGPGTHDDD